MPDVKYIVINAFVIDSSIYEGMNKKQKNNYGAWSFL